MDSLRIGLEWFLNPDHVPLLVAKRAGIFAAHDLDVSWIEPAQHMDAVDEIRAGRMDVAITEPIHLVQDLAKGDELVGFARFLHTNGGVMYLQGGDSPVKRPADMAGLRVQYPGAPGPGGLAIVRSMIEADGGPKDAPLTPVNSGFHHTQALLDGHADVATLVFYNFEILEARAKLAGQDRSPGLFALKDYGIPDFCQLILISTAAQFAAKREVFRRLVKALHAAIDFVRQQPEEARRLWEAESGQDASTGLGREIYDATVACLTYDFSMSSDYYARLASWLHTSGQTATVTPTAGAWTNDLAW